MKKQIIINSTLDEVRIAITEDEQLAELFIDMPDKHRSIGNIYLGRVNNIVQSLNAAFINIGLKQDAFLHFSDIDESLENVITEEDEDIFDLSPTDSKSETSKVDKKLNKETAVALRKVKQANSLQTDNLASFSTKKHRDIKINIEQKQDIIVQVTRESFGTKGAKVTTKIGIPGRYLVLLPFDKLLGVSKKIQSYQERKRIRAIAKPVINSEYGCIIRTASKGMDENEIRRDWNQLVAIWKEIEKKVKKLNAPAMLYQDMHIATGTIRDLLSDDVTKVVIDSKKIYKDLYSYVKSFSPQDAEKIEYYSDKKPIFETYGVEKELENTYKRKINLQSGGSIIVDQTEAMFVIDVNSGRSVSESQQEKTSFKTNLEAAKEIARQIRLRDLGGMIIVDFIDMVIPENQKKLFMYLKKEMRRDRARTTIYPLTKLGLMQLTRQRINQNISEKLSQKCPMCNGTGRIPSKAVLMNTIERWLKKFRVKSKEFKLILEVHPHVASYFTEGTLSKITRLMLKYFTKIKIQQNDRMNINQFRFYSVKQDKDITNEYL
ncbi:MAG TPA: Rne/Rng family ribonuclease [Candidatus Kapabacteria bacterium]|nr:Rne/Rng family ribonuclease [Candidatus Kapabacteria bacterium]